MLGSGVVLKDALKQVSVIDTISVPKDDVEKITKIEVKNAEKGEVTLEKKGDAWEVVKPVQAKANAANSSNANRPRLIRRRAVWR